LFNQLAMETVFGMKVGSKERKGTFVYQLFNYQYIVN